MRQSSAVYAASAEASADLRPGYSGTELDGALLNAVRWTLPASDRPTALHRHPDHEQMGFVVKGRISLEIDGVRHDLETGDAYWVAKGCPHGRMTVEEPGALVIDVFCPPRRDHEASIEILDERRTDA